MQHPLKRKCISYAFWKIILFESLLVGLFFRLFFFWNVKNSGLRLRFLHAFILHTINEADGLVPEILKARFHEFIHVAHFAWKNLEVFVSH